MAVSNTNDVRRAYGTDTRNDGMNNDEHFYQELLDKVTDGIYFVDPLRNITFWNKSAENITGYTAQEMIGTSCNDNKLVHIDGSGNNLCINGCPVSGSISDGNERIEKVYLHHKDGHRVPVVIMVTPLRDDQNEVIGAVEVFRDVSGGIVNADIIEELKKVAFIDPLTELPNRKQIESRLQASYEEKRRYKVPFGLLFIDIDNFKNVNDTYGHSVGDKVLQMVARTLKSHVRTTDLVGRWGGEEFLAVMTHIEQDQLIQIANTMRVLIRESFVEIEEQRVQVTITIGVATAVQDDTIASLIERADKNLYQGKEAGRNRVVFA